MRAWFSVPIVKGIRTGVSVNPNSFITRRLPWFECLSDTGKKVQRVGGAMIVVLFVLWIIAEKDRLDVMWLTMLIVFLVVVWIQKRTMLALFPRQFTDEPPPSHNFKRVLNKLIAAQFGHLFPDNSPSQAARPEQRFNSFGEEIEAPPAPPIARH